MESNKYTCNICNKNYKSYKSVWFHKYKYHENSSKKLNSISSLPQKSSNITQITSDIIEEEPLKCKYCNKNYSRADNLKRHINTCKAKENIIKENEELKYKVEEIKASFEKFKKDMINMMNQKYKMHPKTFQKMVNSNNYSNNNITINNNNIKYIEIGREDLHNVFTKEEKIMLLKQLGSPIENIVRYTHLNDKYPQFQNIIITNIRSKQAYAYNEQLNKFILCDKNDLLDEMMIYRYDDLIEFYKQYSHQLTPKLRETLEKSFKLKDDTSYLSTKCKEFNVILYNECDKDNIKYKLNDDSLNDNILDM